MGDNRRPTSYERRHYEGVKKLAERPKTENTRVDNEQLAKVDFGNLQFFHTFRATRGTATSVSNELGFQLGFHGGGDFAGGAGAFCRLTPLKVREIGVALDEALLLGRGVNPLGEALRKTDFDFVEFVPCLDL